MKRYSCLNKAATTLYSLIDIIPNNFQGAVMRTIYLIQGGPTTSYATHELMDEHATVRAMPSFVTN